jgi:protein tyrosine phosphatase (PTP) superfamily phosphohydrolase (DUF442 family)
MFATRTARMIALPLVAMLNIGSLAAAEVAEIVNYREYSPQLSSSGQPTKAQLSAVADAGFERVVYLAFTDHETSLENEDRHVKDLGMEFAQIPIDWNAPQVSDFYMFAGLMQGGPAKKTLVHCQVNFRASAFSFLYRVVYEDVPVDEAKDDMNSVWVPDDTWRQLIFDVLEDNGISPQCESCLWE